MLPSLPPNYLVDHAHRHPKSSGKIGPIPDLSRYICGPNRQNFIFGNLTHSVTAPPIIGVLTPALAFAIHLILFIGAEEEMIGPNTWGVVARMAHK